jgi:hypothetical protein
MLGPLTLFDKSFLQSLSVDESVFFDHFFSPAICPIFFVETLADLEKAVRQGRTPEQEVGIIASKVPETSGMNVALHSRLALSNLLGNSVPMDGRIPTAGGMPVRFEGKPGIIHEVSPETEAMHRWQKREFLDVERSYAREWREGLNSTDLMAAAAGMRAMGLDPQSCRTLEEAKTITDNFLRGGDVANQIRLAFVFVGGASQYEEMAIENWRKVGSPSLTDYAPYAAYILGVELFFQIAMAANLIGTERASNRSDIAYLFYLPFCHVFVSWDKLHRRCAPYFLRSDQEFVWASDLKVDLQRLIDRYSKLPDDVKEQGLIRFARYPPTDDSDCLTSQLWDRHMHKQWRERAVAKPAPADPAGDAKTVKELNDFSASRRIPPGEVDFNPADAEILQITRQIHVKKGSWWQLPKDLKTKA